MGRRGAAIRVGRDLDAYYLLTYTSSHEADGRFYEVQVRTKAASAQVRARRGYWAPLRAELLGAADLRPSPPPRMLKRSMLIDTWIGLTVDADGAQQVLFTWQPAVLRNRPRPGSAPSIVSLRVTTKEGAVLYEGEIRPPRAPTRDAPGRTSATGLPSRLPVPCGRPRLQLLIPALYEEPTRALVLRLQERQAAAATRARLLEPAERPVVEPLASIRPRNLQPSKLPARQFGHSFLQRGQVQVDLLGPRANQIEQKLLGCG